MLVFVPSWTCDWHHSYNYFYLSPLHISISQTGQDSSLDSTSHSFLDRAKNIFYNLHRNRLLLWMKDVSNKSPKIHHNDHTNQSYVLLCFTGVKIILFWYLIINSKTKPNYSLIYSVVKLNIIRTTELIMTRSLLDCRSELTCWLLLYHPFSPFTYI